MNRSFRVSVLSSAAVAAALLSAACSGAPASAAAPVEPAPVSIRATQVEQQSIDRFVRVTGSLTADEKADVAAETAGRVIGTPVERGTRVTAGTVLIRVSASEADASLREADANAAQLEARLGLSGGQPFDALEVPDVLNAKASLDWAEADFNRIKSLLDQKVVSQAEYDQRLTRARADLARKSAADTVVRAPFNGIVAERLVSTGDYVSRGMKVATVVRIDPVRVELTVPEQYLSHVKAGQAVRLSVDAYPGEIFTARVRFVSPALKADQRALTVEAIAANADGRLKPGLFATALLQQPAPAPALLVPAASVETVAGTSRVYVIGGDNRIEERIVTLGEKVGDRVEIATGVKAGERVAANPRGKLADGVRVQLEG